MYVIGQEGLDSLNPRREALLQLENELFAHTKRLQQAVLIIFDIDGTILLPAYSLNQTPCPDMLEFYNRVRLRAKIQNLCIFFGYVTARDANVPGLSDFTISSLRSFGYLAEPHERLILMDSQRELTPHAPYPQQAYEISCFKQRARKLICQWYSPHATTLLSIGDSWSDIICPAHQSMFRKLANDPKLSRREPSTIIVRHVPSEHPLYCGLKV
jgi:hypothetical protein